jgi:hypothetical protein
MHVRAHAHIYILLSYYIIWFAVTHRIIFFMLPHENVSIYLMERCSVVSCYDVQLLIGTL